MSTNSKFAATTAQLAGMYTDLASWLSFMEMVAVGRPATMNYIRDDRRDKPAELVKVIATEWVTPTSTFANPLGTPPAD